MVKGAPGKGRKQRFMGVKLGEWSHSTSQRIEIFRAYQTRTGKFAIHIERSLDIQQSAQGWQGYLGLGEQRWGIGEHEARLDVYSTPEELREHIPPKLYELIALMALAVSRVGVLLRLASRNNMAGTNSAMELIAFLPLVSSGFIPTGSMVEGVHWANQRTPSTPISPATILTAMI